MMSTPAIAGPEALPAPLRAVVVALSLALLPGCSGVALFQGLTLLLITLVGGLVAFVAALLLTHLAASLPAPGRAAVRLLGRGANVTLIWVLASAWGSLCGALELGQPASALALLALYVLGLRQFVLLGVEVAALVGEELPSGARADRQNDRVFTVRVEGPVNLPGVYQAPRPSLRSPGRTQAGPTCWICGGVNDGHQH